MAKDDAMDRLHRLREAIKDPAELKSILNTDFDDCLELVKQEADHVIGEFLEEQGREDITDEWGEIGVWYWRRGVPFGDW